MFKIPNSNRRPKIIVIMFKKKCKPSGKSKFYLYLTYLSPLKTSILPLQKITSINPKDNNSKKKVNLPTLCDPTQLFIQGQ